MKLSSPSAGLSFDRRIAEIHDHLYANGSKRTRTSIGAEVGKLIHTAFYIEQSSSGRPAFQFTRKEIEQIRTGLGGVQERVVSNLRASYYAMSNELGMYKDEDININDYDLAYVVSLLSGIDFSDGSRDYFGDAVEIFRMQWIKSLGGQFFTDQRVTKLALDLLCFNPLKGDTMVDLCAGTGGFLLAGLKRIEVLLGGSESRDINEAELVRLARASLKGREVDPEVAEVANASLSARLGLLDPSIVEIGDSLQIDPLGLGTHIRQGEYTCAATNPPFGSKITVKNRDILKKFDLSKQSYHSYRHGIRGADLSRTISPRALEVLFVEQNVKMLKPGEGRLAIVVPYQILSGPKALYIRDWLLRHTEILAVVDLPSETFQPHTGTKTALIVLKRRVQPLADSHQANTDATVFMSAPRWIGHDRRGNPVYTKEDDGTLTDTILSDIEDVASAYSEYDAGRDIATVHEHSFSIRMADILADPQLRINALFHKPTDGAAKQADDASPSDRHSVKLGDVVERVFFPSRFKRNYTDRQEGSVPFLGGTNISQLIPVTTKWLRADDPKLSELVVREGWILITRSGTTGTVSSVPAAWDGYAISEHVIRIVPNPDKMPPAYLLAYLRTDKCQKLISKGVFGSVIDHITPEFISNIPIPILSNSRTLTDAVERVTTSEIARQIAIYEMNRAVDDLSLAIQ